MFVHFLLSLHFSSFIDELSIIYSLYCVTLRSWLCGYVVMWLLEQCCRLPVSLGLIHFAVIWTPKIADDKNYSPVISDHNYSLWVFRLENSAWYKHFWLKIFAFAKFFRNPDGWSTVSVVVVPDHSRNMEVLENPLYRLGGISQTRVWLNAVTVSLCEVF